MRSCELILGQNFEAANICMLTADGPCHPYPNEHNYPPRPKGLRHIKKCLRYTPPNPAPMACGPVLGLNGEPRPPEDAQGTESAEKVPILGGRPILAGCTAPCSTRRLAAGALRSLYYWGCRIIPITWDLSSSTSDLRLKPRLAEAGHVEIKLSPLKPRDSHEYIGLALPSILSSVLAQSWWAKSQTFWSAGQRTPPLMGAVDCCTICALSIYDLLEKGLRNSAKAQGEKCRHAVAPPRNPALHTMKG